MKNLYTGILVVVTIVGLCIISPRKSWQVVRGDK